MAASTKAVRLVSVIADGERRAGLLDGDRVLVTRVPGLDAAIGAGVDLVDAGGDWLPLDEVELDAPLRPPVVFCLGQNYRDHHDEKAPVEVKEPEFFLKAGQTVMSPDAPCLLDPRVTAKLDYETELGVVIGRAARHVPPERALEHVLGYVVVNDLTARDRQVVPLDAGGFAMALGPGKNFDGATRLGVWVTPAADVPDPHALALRTRVNGEVRQRNTTAAMIHRVPELIAFLSRLLTLQPGAVVSTGTPGGTGWGQDAELGGTRVTPAGCVPGRYLAPGDHVQSRIEGVGELSFDVVAE
jgi:2-keto-4-pentenoate hydratase/2-oxohepta-3-ene-1,7-dioic acid hydratase in catechol pathway